MIYSSNNTKIKNIIKLKDIKNIKKQKKYIIEGLHLLEEAFNANVVELIIVNEHFDKELPFDVSNIEMITIDNKTSKLLSDTVTSQGVFAVCNIEEKTFNISDYSKVLILDQIQDPGNLGTIIRTADAFGFEAVILSNGTTNMYAPKVMRSMQGSNFHLDCFEKIDVIELLSQMLEYDILATSLDTEYNLEDISSLKDKCAIILGNEANGISNTILEKVNKKVKIAMPGQAESLNVAVAAGIIMHYVKNIIK